MRPPLKDLETSIEVKNQKTPDGKKSGFCKKNKKDLIPPSIFDIQPLDFKSFPRMEELYQQATTAKWLEGSEANKINFFAAGVKVSRAKNLNNPSGAFVAIVKKKLWHHIGQKEEDLVIKALKKNNAQKSVNFLQKLTLQNMFTLA
jgi:hypothetical protein